MATFTQESLSSFFNQNLLENESDEDIDKIKWVTAFNKLSIAMTKKDVIKIFDYIDEEQVGYIDRFDFMEFCNTHHFQNETIKHLKDILISRVEGFLRFQQIGNDPSIHVIYSKHTVNPCKSINEPTHAPPDPYYTRYYEDDIFHDFDPQEYEMLQIKNCLCCSHCGKQFNLYTLWKKHESKCKYDAEKYIAYLIQAVEDDLDISFLHNKQTPAAVALSNGYNTVPPPPPLKDGVPPPPPPLDDDVIRYNENEMAEVLSQIPDKVPIWSRLFASAEHPFVAQRLQCIQDKKSYIKCIKSSACKDYRDVVQKKMSDLLFTSYSTRHNKTHTFPKVSRLQRKSSSPIQHHNMHDMNQHLNHYHKPRRRSNTSIVISAPTTPILSEICVAVGDQIHQSLNHLTPTSIQSSKIRYTHNLTPHKVNMYKLALSHTELTPEAHIPKYIGDVDESDIDDYDIRASDTIDDTDYTVVKNNQWTAITRAKSAFPYSDNEGPSMENQYKMIDVKKQLENLRSKSSCNLVLISPEPNLKVEQTLSGYPHTHHQNDKLLITYEHQLRIEEQQTVGQQTLGTNDSDDDSSSLSELDRINAMIKDTKSKMEQKSSEEVSSLPSVTEEDDEEKEERKTHYKGNQGLKVIKHYEEDDEFDKDLPMANTNTNPLAKIKTSGYFASVDMGSQDLSELMSINPLIQHGGAMDTPPPLSPALSVHDIDRFDAYDSSDGLYALYYEQVVDLILEYSGLAEAVYVDGFFQLHEMVFDIYNHSYKNVWHKYRLPLWLKLLFDQSRLNELEKHYGSSNTSNNYEHGRMTWIYNLHDMIYYDETLFTHLIHCYGIPPITALQSLIWFHLSHNHHTCTDLDVFALDQGIQWTQSDVPIVDYILDHIADSIYTDPVQSCLFKSYVFQPYLHHRAQPNHIQRIMTGKNRRKLLPNLYYPRYRYVFYYNVLQVLLQNIWSELPVQCAAIIYTFWCRLQQETNGNNEWLFGNQNTIDMLLTGADEDKLRHCQFIMTVYLWDGMCGIALLLTSAMLIAIHSKQSIRHFYHVPLLQTETDKLCKVYRFLYDYILHKTDISLNVIQQLCHL
eukprot:227771_1